MTHKISEGFKNQYKSFLDMTENSIKKYFTSVDKSLLQKDVFEAMEYAVCGGGKRIRPVMVLAAAKMCGGDLGDALKVATALEFIHNYSLIHDDLPCMDNDILRRGRKTCHVVYGEDIALLAGDALLNTAFEILSDVNSFKKISADKLLKIIRIMSLSSGAMGMIGGQTVDLKYEKSLDTDLDILKYLHERKTGALIRCAISCGCICGDIDDIAYKNMDDYAKSLGLAFQIKDDILDVCGNEELLGKPVGSDVECGKSTFVSILGIKKAKEYLISETDKAKSYIKKVGDRAEFFSELADFLLDREF